MTAGSEPAEDDQQHAVRQGSAGAAFAEGSDDGDPEGSPYDWYRRAVMLLEGGNPDAAAVLLSRLREVDPTSTSVLETYARALFDSKRYLEAVWAFTELTERSPAEDYAHYGLGLSLWRLQRFPAARDHLAMAVVMRPQRADYAQALAQVKATLRVREETGLPLEGPVSQ
jgi:predicted Zn-dependent protease